MQSFIPVLLILGGGANIGSSVARSFAARGYKVASISRSPREPGKDGVDLHIRGDLSDINFIADAFEKVTSSLGPPGVVVYNAAAVTRNVASDPLSLPVDDLIRDFYVNTASVLAAAHLATVGFGDLPPAAPQAFIYTGNILNKVPIAPLLSLGMGKSATAHLLASASEAYKNKGYRFYYADERNLDGSPAFAAISGRAHAEFYIQLAEGKIEVPWLATFVSGVGYTHF